MQLLLQINSGHQLSKNHIFPWAGLPVPVALGQGGDQMKTQQESTHAAGATGYLSENDVKITEASLCPPWQCHIQKNIPGCVGMCAPFQRLNEAGLLPFTLRLKPNLNSDWGLAATLGLRRHTCW